MKLIVGLGNPGTRYQQTRHNAGFIYLDYFASRLNAEFRNGKGEYQYTHAVYKDTRFYLLKPATYMNRSGFAVKDFMDLYKIDYRDILIIYDDFNLPLGTIRIRPKGSDGGHNGIADIIFNTETLEFPRMRIGIGSINNSHIEDYVKYVLSDFTPEEVEILKKIAPFTKDAILCFLEEGILAAMNKYNRNFLPENDVKKDTLNF